MLCEELLLTYCQQPMCSKLISRELVLSCHLPPTPTAHPIHLTQTVVSTVVGKMSSHNIMQKVIEYSVYVCFRICSMCWGYKSNPCSQLVFHSQTAFRKFPLLSLGWMNCFFLFVPISQCV